MTLLPTPRHSRSLRFAFWAILIAPTSLVTGPVAAEQVFDQAFSHSTNEHRGAAVGDLDGNGTLDVVATNFRGDNITVQLNDGTGHLSPETSYFTGLNPIGVAVGDMDGDGDLDAVVANLNSFDISVLLNDGTGVFGEPTSYISFRPFSLVLGDIDGDDDLDVVLADDGSGYVTYFTNDGEGQLSQQFGPFLDGAESAGDVALGDLDGDGDLDLAAVTRTEIEEGVFASDLLIAFNENGQFTTDQIYEWGGDGIAVDMGDLDGDGDVDVALGGSGVRIYLNQGNGALDFSETLSYTFITDLKMVDVDDDDDLDLAMAVTFGVEVAENEGGTFADGGRYSTQRVIQPFGFGLFIHMTRPWAVVPADMDDDGAVDLVAANGGNWVQEPEPEDFFGYISILKNDGAGTYGTARLHTVGDGGLGSGPAFVDMADFDGDGATDMVTANPETDDVTVVLNAAMDEFGEHPNYPVGPEPTRLAIGDLDGDRVLDLVVSNRSNASVSVLRGAPDGTFAAEERFSTYFLPADVAVGDLDGDGDLDVAVGHEIGTSVSILINDGNGELAPYALTSTGTIYTDSIALSDVDGDGALDLVVASHGAYWNEEPSTVSVLRNLGDASFTVASSKSFGLNIVSIAVADFDGDDAPDIATLERDDAAASVLKNVGGTTFGTPDVLPITPDARQLGQHLTTGDLDLDGAPDLVTANGDRSVSVLLNKEDAFERDDYLPTQDGDVVYGTAWETIAVAVGDLNGDGRPDLAVADAEIDHVVTTINASDAMPPHPPCPADIDGDEAVGFNDLAQLLGNWGLCPGGASTCPADIDGDGSVGFNDLSILLGSWGPCVEP